MNIILSGKNIEITDSLKDRVNTKLSKLERYFKNQDTDAHVTLSVEKQRRIIEVTIPYKGIIFRAEEESEDMYSAIDNVVDVLERQIRKNKTRLERKVREQGIIFGSIEPIQNSQDEELVKIKKFAVKPMSSDEAILQMNLIGHQFFVFRNMDNEEVNVVYRRNDGKYGLIQPENF